MRKYPEEIQTRTITRPAFAMLIALAFASGCTPVMTYDIQPPNAHFGGLREAMTKHDRVGLFFIHGMGGYSNDDPEPLIEAMCRELNFHEVAAERAIVELSSDAASSFCFGSVRNFANADLSKHVRVYTLCWNLIVASHRDELQRIDQSPGRVWVNRKIKSSLMNSKLSDVMVYLGGTGERVRQWTKGQLSRLADEVSDDGEVVLVSFSLGSFVLLETLHEMEQQGGTDGDAARVLLAKMGNFFMLANQVPLLQLARLKSTTDKSDAGPTSPPEAPEAPDVLARFLKQHEALMPTAAAMTVTAGDPRLPQFRVIAISDPNDLLSYPIPEYLVADHDVINITMSAAEWAYGGILVNPIEAHAGYGEDADVIDLIINGR